MDHDPLSNLLRHADAATPGPREPPPDLTDRVRRRVRRRRQVRHGAAAVTALGVVAAVFVAVSPPRTGRTGGDSSPPPQLAVRTNPVPVSVPITEDPAVLRAELDQLRREAEFARTTADRMARAEAAARRARPSLGAIDPLDRIEQQRERAALILVHHADRLHRELGRKEAAAAAYRDAAERFPRTHWAAVANDRLRELEI